MSAGQDCRESQVDHPVLTENDLRNSGFGLADLGGRFLSGFFNLCAGRGHCLHIHRVVFFGCDLHAVVYGYGGYLNVYLMRNRYLFVYARFIKNP